ncbi:hypothetical protein F2Q69_00019343 [Brassica cretica]|uniref:Uncharacterized protein n=1 Tax=Brassica cretica TaxID=69181 RepID=A0A8S9QJZ8_BRACR|nr:hypothetical protein F2Q69_00019343 [Brassica cretica]
MTSRHTRSNAQGPLFTLSNEELARLERQNRQSQPTNNTIVDHGGQDDLTAAMALMQQQMQQMQQTINTQEAARQAAADLAAQQNKEHDRSKSVNSTDDLAAKVDQLLKCNQSQVFIMEEAASENNVSDTTTEGDNTVDDQQEVSYVNGQGWQYKNYHPNPNSRAEQRLSETISGKNICPEPSEHNQFQNQKQQTAQPTTPSPTTAPQDEIKGLATMMQQLLQGQQIQGKAMNQVTTDINSRMNHMFNDLSTKYDNVASHMRQMDVQIAQTAESVKRQQGTLPGKTDNNPKE